jgi:hypothetical protein
MSESKFVKKVRPDVDIGEMRLTDSGKMLVKVEQDITFKAGDVIAFQTLEDELSFAVQKGWKTPEQKDEIISKVGAWKLGKLTKLPPRKNA